jgi:hypothetical protein
MNAELLFAQALVSITDEEFIEVFYPGLHLDSLITEDGLVGEGFAISSKRLFSQKYAGCNGVALFGKEHCGLSHYNLDLGNPEIHLHRMIDLLLEKEPDAVAFLIGGRKSHAELNLKVLEQHNIPVRGSYIDNYGFGNPESLKISPIPAKDVLVLPKEGHVLVRSVTGYDSDSRHTYLYQDFKVR